MENEPQPAASLAESIASADEGRQLPPSPLPKGWAGLVERDRRSRAKSHPNATGGYLNILFPWRLHIAVGGTVLVLVLLLLNAM